MKILVIPDTQVKVGSSTEHIKAAGNYLVRHKPDHVVVIGDWWDMPSLSVFNSNKEAEGLKLKADLDAGENAMLDFLGPLIRYNVKRRQQKKKVYRPKLTYIVGNHDPQVRIPRLIQSNPILEGFLEETTDTFLTNLGFEVVPFLEIKNIEGIRFSHYICNPHSLKGSPLGGAIDTMLKNAGHSFVMGHQQTYKMGKHYLADGTQRLGIVAGAFYDHEESYMSPQGNRHWRGIVQLNEVKDGSADVCELSIDYLKRKYL
jgi:predicted phosphodiesterase